MSKVFNVIERMMCEGYHIWSLRNPSCIMKNRKTGSFFINQWDVDGNCSKKEVTNVKIYKDLGGHDDDGKPCVSFWCFPSDEGDKMIKRMKEENPKILYMMHLSPITNVELVDECEFKEVSDLFDINKTERGHYF